MDLGRFGLISMIWSVSLGSLGFREEDLPLDLLESVLEA